MERPFTADSLWTDENGVLKNKLGIDKIEELDKKEEELVNAKINKIILGNFDKESFLKVHETLYEDLYDFAGKMRNENVILDGIMLCQHEVIDLCLTDLLDNLKNLKINNLQEMAEVLAYYYSELSIICPFRDGNEPVIRVFLELFAVSNGYKIYFEELIKTELKVCLTYSFYNDTSKLTELFKINLEKN